MEKVLKELAELVEEVGYEEIITLKIKINPSSVLTTIKINESMINYIKAISTLEKDDVLNVFEPAILEVKKTSQILKDKIKANQKEFKNEDTLKAIEKILKKLEEE